MTVWRLHIRPDATRTTDPARFCLDRNIIGVGWSVETPPISREDYFEKGRLRYPGSKGWKQAANALVDGMQKDDLVWFRDYFGDYFLARIDGPWEYRDSEDYVAQDVVNVRPAEIYKVNKRVPGKIESSFAPRATVQRIASEEIALYSKIVFNQLSGRHMYHIAKDEKSRSLFELLSPSEIEDAVGLFLQVTQKSVMIPSSRSRIDNTIRYEYELVSPESGKRFLVQVKSGSVPLNVAEYVREGEEWWLFATGGYDGHQADTVHIITPAALEEFIHKARRLMPEPIEHWLTFQEDLEAQ